MTHANANISCDEFADALSDLLERDVDDVTRAHLEAHALSCAECGSLLADLRKLRIDAANLPALEPSRDLWAGIAARIETPVVEISAGRGELVGGGTVERWNGGTQKTRRMTPVWMGLAAAGLVAVTATVTYNVTTSRNDVRSTKIAQQQPTEVTPVAAVAAAPAARSSVDSTVPPVHRSTVPPAVLVSNKSKAEQTYDSEIRQLQAILAARRAQLDTTTIAVVEKNLKIIDDAIAQCRLALRKDPASRFLMQSLNDALDTKVQLLRTATMLPSRT